MKKLSIIIPAYNEESRILATLDSYYNFFNNKFKDDFELIVVPNNCKDNTTKLVNSFSKKHKNVVCYEINYFVGKGGAVIEGFKLAKGQFIGFVDADDSTKADAFYDLYKNINNYDCVIASRWIKGAIINKKQPIMRRIASRTFNIIIRLLFRINVRDSQCGAKIFRRKVLLEIIPNLTTTRWAFDVDLLYQLKNKDFTIKEIPTVWNDNPNSKLNVKRASIEMFFAIGRLRLIHSPFKFIVIAYDKLAGDIQK